MPWRWDGRLDAHEIALGASLGQQALIFIICLAASLTSMGVYSVKAQNNVLQVYWTHLGVWEGFIAAGTRTGEVSGDAWDCVREEPR